MSTPAAAADRAASLPVFLLPPAPPGGWNERRDRAFCRRLTRASGSNFYYSFLLLPAARRRAIYSVYALCREIDDVVDRGSGGDAGACLAAWQEEIRRTFRGAPAHPITREIARHGERFRLTEGHFLEIVRGVEMDLSWRRYERFEDLYQYCYRVAGVVGLLCARVFGQREIATSDYAVSLGVGFQIVNILRDLRQDGRRGRLYLPLEDLRRFGCAEEALLGSAQPGDGFDPLIRFEAARAREILRQARCRLPAADRRAMWPAEAMAAVYEKLLGHIEADPRRILTENVSMPRWRRAALVIGARLRRL
jgi:phytoene synthase